MIQPRPLASWSLAVLAAAAGGCAVPVAGALDEPQANRVVVALEQAGVGADKEPDPAAEGRYRVTVERDEAPHAIATLRDEELPSAPSAGVLDAVGKGSIVPSPLAEHAQWTAGLAGDLERTLGAIDGVLAARVHLSVPQPDPLADAPRPRATASVMLKHRGAQPPIASDEVRRLVAGAVAGLAIDDVAVVSVARPAPAAGTARTLVHLGPLAVTRGSVGWLRVGVAGVVATHLTLLAAVVALWWRARRSRDGAGEGALAGAAAGSRGPA